MNIKNTFNAVKEFTRINSPTIMLVAGLASIGVAVVSAIIATKKVDEINDMEDIYITDDHKKNTVKKVVAYIPTVVATGVAVACFIGDHKVLSTQRDAAIAAYLALLGEYTALKEKYTAEKGIEAANDIREIEQKTKEDPNVATGKFYFAEGFSTDWRPNCDMNRDFLKIQEGMLNVLLQARGHLFVNDVLTSLGMPNVAYGQLAGWIYDKKHPTGDNIISFGIDWDNPENNDADTEKFVRGESDAVVISLNFDGDIVTGDDNFESRQYFWRKENDE